MLKWAEIGLITNQERYTTLGQHLKEAGFENEVSFIEATPDNFSEKIKAAMSELDGIKIGRGLGELVLTLFDHQSVVMSRLKAADCLVKENGKWWPRSAAYEGMSSLLVKYGDKLDLDSMALVVGSGAAARVACGALARVGYKSFGLSDSDPLKANQLVEDLKKAHFGLEFKVVLKDELILLPGKYGVLVNTTPLEPTNEILGELYYFNFLKPGGLVIDFIIKPVNTHLIIESQGVGATTVHGYELSGFADCIWAEWFCGAKLSSKSYSQSLYDVLSEDLPDKNKKNI